MKTLMLALIVFLIGCNTPIRVVETIATDSLTGKSIKTVTKYYDSTRYPSVNPVVNYNPYPFGWYDPFWRSSLWYNPRPIIIHTGPKRR